MKRVRLVHDRELVFLSITDVESETQVSVALNHKEAQELGEGLFKAGRVVESSSTTP